MSKSVEELLRPRYEVTNDYPNSKFDIGTILIRDAIIENWTHDTTEGAYKMCGLKEDAIVKYPHLFRKLEWWEYLKDDDLPEYVKDENGRVWKVATRDQDQRIWHNDNEIEMRFIRRYFPASLPAPSAPVKEDFLNVLIENRGAMVSAKKEKMNVMEIFETDDIYDAVINQMNDLIEIYKSNYEKNMQL